MIANRQHKLHQSKSTAIPPTGADATGHISAVFRSAPEAGEISVSPPLVTTAVPAKVVVPGAGPGVASVNTRSGVGPFIVPSRKLGPMDDELVQVAAVFCSWLHYKWAVLDWD